MAALDLLAGLGQSMTVSSKLCDDIETLPMTPAEEPPRTGGLPPASWLIEGARQALAGPAWIVAVSLAGVGGLAHAAGFSFGVAVGSTLIIWAVPAQMLFFSSSIAHVPLPVIALSITLSSVRLLPMCLSLLPILRGSRTRVGTLIYAAHFTAITVWAESIRRLPDVPRDARVPFYFGFAHMCLVLSAIVTGIGFLLMTTLPAPFEAALLFLSPVYFIAALVRNAREAMDWLAIGLGLGLAPITQATVGGGFDLAVLGLGGGALAYFIGRVWRRREVA
jgi:predicted branched-subunit amino acid permease